MERAGKATSCNQKKNEFDYFQKSSPYYMGNVTPKVSNSKPNAKQSYEGNRNVSKHEIDKSKIKI